MTKTLTFPALPVAECVPALWAGAEA